MSMRTYVIGVLLLATPLVWGQSPRLTPRGSEVRPYPAPAVTPLPAGGVVGPYNAGLAAAAPVGTPYLRSPAFAGPPIIYMPQTVTRVLVPGSTPYPSNVLPATQYAYASAPFLRTDIYVNLPYGTFYWPQGFAGVQPVAPSLPPYVEAPATAIMSAQSSYAAQRYMTLPPAQAGEQAIAVAPAATPATEMVLVPTPEPAPTPTPAPPAPTPAKTAEVSPFAPEAQMPALTPAVPVAPTPTPAGQLPPSLGMLPPLSQAVMPPPAPQAPSGGTGGPEIIVDDKTPGGLILDPPDAWRTSVNVADSHEGGSLIAPVDGKPAKATFVADVPEDGEYEIYLWWTASQASFRPTEVPVTVYTASGPVQAKVDQTKGPKMWNLVGKYSLKAGQKQNILTISTEGLPASQTQFVSVDAMKLVKVKP
ncbi:MAG: hypothetical protein D6691_02545 [Candidatus Hydrogenedentota bacterium]|nr:MAG: hypothetical protein D6691_02545 [Candidatus Hydrogenedentota bacterium]GIX45703.1 MAG: hypothetical protein KatS3mg130_2111 [Candidatus Sumerlaea sp.]